MCSTNRINVDKLWSKIKKLNEILWEDRVPKPRIDDWLSNFEDDRCGIDVEKQRECALYLLSNFLFYNEKLVRVLLKSLYEDLFRRPIIHKIRENNNNTLDHKLIAQGLSEEIEKTRFLGLGNPSESGCHLLYYFRQENKLKKKLFINPHEIFLLTRTDNSVVNQTVINESLRNQDISRYVFIDDFCGSGSQCIHYSHEIIEGIKSLNNAVEVNYFSLAATQSGLETIRSDSKYDRVESVVELDDTFRYFSDTSRYFSTFPDYQMEMEKDASQAFCHFYGEILKDELREEKVKPLGFDDCQLLIGFHHNIPNNSIPVLWAETDTFKSLFPRYSKIYP